MNKPLTVTEQPPRPPANSRLVAVLTVASLLLPGCGSTIKSAKQIERERKDEAALAQCNSKRHMQESGISGLAHWVQLRTVEAMPSGMESLRHRIAVDRRMTPEQEIDGVLGCFRDNSPNYVAAVRCVIQERTALMPDLPDKRPPAPKPERYTDLRTCQKDWIRRRPTDLELDRIQHQAKEAVRQMQRAAVQPHNDRIRRDVEQRRRGPYGH